MAKFHCRTESEFRSRVAEAISRNGFQAWALMSGESSNYRFDQAIVNRFNAAIAELAILAERAQVLPAAPAPERDACFQRFMGAALGGAAGEKRS